MWLLAGTPSSPRDTRGAPRGGAEGASDNGVAPRVFTRRMYYSYVSRAVPRIIVARSDSYVSGISPRAAGRAGYIRMRGMANAWYRAGRASLLAGSGSLDFKWVGPAAGPCRAAVRGLPC